MVNSEDEEVKEEIKIKDDDDLDGSFHSQDLLNELIDKKTQ